MLDIPFVHNQLTTLGRWGHSDVTHRAKKTRLANVICSRAHVAVREQRLQWLALVVLGCCEDQHQTLSSPRLFQAGVQQGNQLLKTAATENPMEPVATSQLVAQADVAAFVEACSTALLARHPHHGLVLVHDHTSPAGRSLDAQLIAQPALQVQFLGETLWVPVEPLDPGPPPGAVKVVIHHNSPLASKLSSAAVLSERLGAHSRTSCFKGSEVGNGCVVEAIVTTPVGDDKLTRLPSRRDELVAGAFPCRAAFAAVGLGDSRIHLRCLAVVKISIKPSAAQGSSKQECSKGISS
ncbi:hypothetical protein V8C86DRAFT_2440820 [Haematococcus lacustris]